MNSIFAMPVFDATVVYDGNELFKGRGAAQQWGERLGAELRCQITPTKIGTGWALCGCVDGVDVAYGIHGQRLKRIGGD